MKIPASVRRRAAPAPAVTVARIVPPANAEQARRRDAAIALLIDLGRRQPATALASTSTANPS